MGKAEKIEALKKHMRTEIKNCSEKMHDQYLQWYTELNLNPDSYEKISRLVYGSKFCWNCKFYQCMWTRTEDGIEKAQYGVCRKHTTLYKDILTACNGFCDEFERKIE